MTETEKERCEKFCAQFGDPPCFDEWVCGPDVEVCSDCKDTSVNEGKENG